MTGPMNEQEKLRVLVSHWIEHNREHADQFRRHSRMAGRAAAEIEAAADAMILSNRHLEAALKALGGTVEKSRHH